MAAVDWLRQESAIRRPPATSIPSPRVSFPQEFICPLSSEVMRDPVIISSGKSFERVYIERWFAQGRTTCPKNGEPLTHQMLTPNEALQKLISDWCKSHMVTLKPLRPSSPLTPAGENTRNPSIPPSPASGERFDLAKARAAAAAAADRAAAGSAGSSAATGAGGSAASPRISPQSILERRHSLQSNSDNGSTPGASTAGSSAGGSGPAAVETPIKLTNSSSANAYVSAVPAAANIPPAIPKHLRPSANDGPLQRTMSPRRKGDQSPATPCDASASPRVLPRNSSDPWLSSADEDAKNDAALGSFLSGNTGGNAGRAQRQGSRRGSASPQEAVSYSKQFLSATPTRRSRRTSEQGSVTEMRPLIDALRTGDVAQRREAVHTLRIALKEAPENRTRLVAAGGIRPLMQMLLSTDGPIVEQASAATLYLSLQWDGAMEVVSAGGVRNLVEVLKTSRGGLCLTPRGANANDPINSSLMSPRPDGSFEATEVAKSNAAAALFALSNAEENKKVVWSAGAVPPLINLLRKATCARTKKDCCLALYNLSLFPKAAEDAIKHGLVRQVFALLEGEDEAGVEEKAAVLLCALVKYPQGIYALRKEEDVEFTLIGIMESGSEKAAELSAGTLLSLAKADGDDAMSEILSEGCLPPLVKLAGNGKPDSDSRALLAMLREFAQIRSGGSVAGSQPGTPMAGSRPTTPLGRGGMR